MDARTSCLRWHRPHKVFPWLGVPLPQPETHCGVMLGRVQGPLIQESDVSDASESITSASTKAGPSHSLGLGRWQCKVLAGGKLSWGSSALSSPSQNKAGKPLDGHWRRQWRRGWWDTGSCQVLGLCRRTHCTCSLAHATVPVDERDACSAYDLKHEPISWWGDSTAPPGYFTLNTAKGQVLPLCFHSAALKEGVIGLPLVWQMGVKANPAFPMELDLKQSVGFFFMWIAVFDGVTLCHVRRDLFTLVGLIGSVSRAHCYRVGETGAGMYRSYRNPANVLFDLKTKLNLMFQIWRTVSIQL